MIGDIGQTGRQTNSQPNSQTDGTTQTQANNETNAFLVHRFIAEATQERRKESKRQRRGEGERERDTHTHRHMARKRTVGDVWRPCYWSSHIPRPKAKVHTGNQELASTIGTIYRCRKRIPGSCTFLYISQVACLWKDWPLGMARTGHGMSGLNVDKI